MGVAIYVRVLWFVGGSASDARCSFGAGRLRKGGGRKGGEKRMFLTHVHVPRRGGKEGRKTQP